MRQRPFLKTFLQRKCFFCSECDLVLFWPNPEIWSDFLFSNARLVVSACPADCLVFFLEIDCINLKNLKAELATIIHSSISGLVSLCYLPTRPLGTVRWGSQKTRFRTIERVKKVVSTSEHLYWLMLESLDLFYPFFRRIRDQKRLGQP